MIPNRLMRDTVTLVYRDPAGTPDRYGDRLPTETSRATVPGWMVPVATTEGGALDERGKADFMLLLNPEWTDQGVQRAIAPPDRTDQVEWDGRTMDVHGEPKAMRRGGETTVHHYEILVREVQL